LAGPDVLASRPRQRRADAAGPAGHLRSPGSARRPCPPRCDQSPRWSAGPCRPRPHRRIVLLCLSPDHRPRR